MRIMTRWAELGAPQEAAGNGRSPGRAGRSGMQNAIGCNGNRTSDRSVGNGHDDSKAVAGGLSGESAGGAGGFGGRQWRRTTELVVGRLYRRAAGMAGPNGGGKAGSLGRPVSRLCVAYDNALEAARPDGRLEWAAAKGDRPR